METFLLHGFVSHIIVFKQASMCTCTHAKHAWITSISPSSPSIDLHVVSWHITKRLKQKTIFSCSVVHTFYCYDVPLYIRPTILSSPCDTTIHVHVNKDPYGHSPHEENRSAKDQEGGCALLPNVT